MPRSGAANGQEPLGETKIDVRKANWLTLNEMTQLTPRQHVSHEKQDDPGTVVTPDYFKMRANLVDGLKKEVKTGGSSCSRIFGINSVGCVFGIALMRWGEGLTFGIK